MQQFESFRVHRAREQAHTCDIAARPIDAGHEAGFDWIAAIHEHDRCNRGCRFCCQCGDVTTERCDDTDMPPNQIGRERRQPVRLAFGPAIFDGHVLALDKASFLQAPTERVHMQRGRGTVKKPDHWYRRLLLRLRRKRPCHCAAKHRDELASPHDLPRTPDVANLPHRRLFCCASQVARHNGVSRMPKLLPNHATTRLSPTASPHAHRSNAAARTCLPTRLPKLPRRRASTAVRSKPEVAN
jgi:hypothetical protein